MPSSYGTDQRGIKLRTHAAQHAGVHGNSLRPTLTSRLARRRYLNAEVVAMLLISARHGHGLGPLRSTRRSGHELVTECSIELCIAAY